MVRPTSLPNAHTLTHTLAEKLDPALGNGTTDLVGGSDKYRATCRPCYNGTMMETESKADDQNNALDVPGVIKLSSYSSDEELGLSAIDPITNLGGPKRTMDQIIQEFDDGTDSFGEDRLYAGIESENIHYGYEKATQ